MRRKERPIPSHMEREQRIALELFRSDSFLVVNKTLLKQIGIMQSIFLANLMDKFHYWKDRGLLQEDGSFFITHEDQYEQTGLSEYQIDRKSVV